MRLSGLDRFLESLRRSLAGGLSPEKLAWGLALGFAVALFPALGVTTLLAAGIAMAFGLNMILLQAINYLAYPLQLALLLPFYHLGEWLFQEPQSSFSLSKIVDLLRHDPLSVVRTLWTLTWHAALAWLILSLLVVPLLVLFLRPLLRQLLRNYGNSSPLEIPPEM